MGKIKQPEQVIKIKFEKNYKTKSEKGVEKITKFHDDYNSALSRRMRI